MELGIKGKHVVVTASSKGIGKATAEGFLNEGCKVAICSSNELNLKKTAEELSRFKENLIWKRCDLNSSESIKSFIEFVKKNFGDIDILVNNCGGPFPGTHSTLSIDDWNNGFRQVLMSVVELCNLVLPGMKNSKWGRIINITSLSVKQPVENLMLSNTFRTGLIGYAKTLSTEIGESNITVNTVAPGYTLTERLKELADLRAKDAGITQEEILQGMAESVPVKRIGSPEDIANLILFLASEKASYITGTTTQVDGGVIKSTF